MSFTQGPSGVQLCCLNKTCLGGRGVLFKQNKRQWRELAARGRVPRRTARGIARPKLCARGAGYGSAPEGKAATAAIGGVPEAGSGADPEDEPMRARAPTTRGRGRRGGMRRRGGASVLGVGGAAGATPPVAPPTDVPVGEVTGGAPARAAAAPAALAHVLLPAAAAGAPALESVFPARGAGAGGTGDGCVLAGRKRYVPSSRRPVNAFQREVYAHERCAAPWRRAMFACCP